MAQDAVVIASYARTPIGAFQGAFEGVSSTELGSVAVRAAVERAGVAPQAIERIYMGCVLPAGLGQAPARQAALGAGLPLSVEATTVNKMCGSGMQAVIMAAEAIGAGAIDVAVAGGMESMTGAPYLLAKHRGGARIGHDQIIDSMMLDGLEDAYAKGKPMGAFAEEAARSYEFSRAEQEAYAIESLTRARSAIQTGAFTAEVVAVPVKGRGGETTVAHDEQPGKAKPEKIPSRRAARSPPRPPPRFPTAPRRSCWRAPARRGSGDSPSPRASSRLQLMRMSPASSQPRLCPRSARFSPRLVGASATSIFSRSTRLSRSSR